VAEKHFTIHVAQVFFFFIPLAAELIYTKFHSKSEYTNVRDDLISSHATSRHNYFSVETN